MSQLQSIAALNNAEWCDLVCRTHGLAPTMGDDAWTSDARTPPYYPDAVTLVPRLSVAGLLDRVKASAGCSIKDSFASLDLSAAGFRVLFDAEWIERPPAAIAQTATTPPWEVVSNPEMFALWEQAWRGLGARDVLRVDLLGHPSVKVLAAMAGERVVAGAVLNRSATVVGVSNFFAEPGSAGESWSGCLALADTLFAGATLVGYERGDGLETARAKGFRTVGSLRVWSLDD